MARRGVKKREFEKLDDATIGRVISLLEGENPITKKAACETLNITYNTSRLNKIIQEYKERQEWRKKRFAINKGKPFSDLEIKELVTDYLNGNSIASIADSLYRSTHTIKKKINELNLPERTKNATYQNPDFIPDEAVAETFEIGELVWSARYGAVAEIRAGSEWYQGEIYSIWVFGKHNEFAYQPWWELGKLEVVKRFGLEAEQFVQTEKPQFAYRID
jgi:hypothetical protein